MAPSSSLGSDISMRWRELHGCTGWDGLLDPLDPSLKQELTKYAVFTQASYDAFDLAEGCENLPFTPDTLLDRLSLSDRGYSLTRFIYAVPGVSKRVKLLLHHEDRRKKSELMGFVLVSNDAETRRIGHRNIVVAWRGTRTKKEWLEDLRLRKKPLRNGKEGTVKVHKGFQSIYTSRDSATSHNRTASASEQAMEEIRRLTSEYKSRGEVSLTVTGHSLGGALALLNAHEAAGEKSEAPNLVSVISFGAPRVGNAAFERELENRGVKVLRLVHSPDVVPEAISPVLNEKMATLVDLHDNIKDKIYVHVGKELKLKSCAPLHELLSVKGLCRYHSMETYLQLVGIRRH